jgi:hypothetical protein
MHASPPQDLPQAPQFAGSPSTLVHLVPQHVGADPEHRTPQPPQLFGSPVVSMHWPLHSVYGHVQLPPTHWKLAAQVMPHPPQLLLSEPWTFVHPNPGQSTSGLQQPFEHVPGPSI